MVMDKEKKYSLLPSTCHWLRGSSEKDVSTSNDATSGSPNDTATSSSTFTSAAEPISAAITMTIPAKDPKQGAVGNLPRKKKTATQSPSDHLKGAIANGTGTNANRFSHDDPQSDHESNADPEIKTNTSSSSSHAMSSNSNDAIGSPTTCPSSPEAVAITIPVPPPIDRSEGNLPRKQKTDIRTRSSRRKNETSSKTGGKAEKVSDNDPQSDHESEEKPGTNTEASLSSHHVTSSKSKETTASLTNSTDARGAEAITIPALKPRDPSAGNLPRKKSTETQTPSDLKNDPAGFESGSKGEKVKHGDPQSEQEPEIKPEIKTEEIPTSSLWSEPFKFESSSQPLQPKPLPNPFGLHTSTSNVPQANTEHSPLKFSVTPNPFSSSSTSNTRGSNTSGTGRRRPFLRVRRDQVKPEPTFFADPKPGARSCSVVEHSNSAITNDGRGDKQNEEEKKLVLYSAQELDLTKANTRVAELEETNTELVARDAARMVEVEKLKETYNQMVARAEARLEEMERNNMLQLQRANTRISELERMLQDVDSRLHNVSNGRAYQQFDTPTPQTYSQSVIVTETGQCYHLDSNCWGLRNARTTRWTNRPSSHLRPCSICT